MLNCKNQDSRALFFFFSINEFVSSSVFKIAYSFKNSIIPVKEFVHLVYKEIDTTKIQYHYQIKSTFLLFYLDVVGITEMVSCINSSAYLIMLKIMFVLLLSVSNLPLRNWISCSLFS